MRRIAKGERIEQKLAEGLWKVFFFAKDGKPRTWFVFVDNPKGMPISKLTLLPRVKKGKTMRHVFHVMGLFYPKKQRLAKKRLKDLP